MLLPKDHEDKLIKLVLIFSVYHQYTGLLKTPLWFTSFSGQTNKFYQSYFLKRLLSILIQQLSLQSLISHSTKKPLKVFKFCVMPFPHLCYCTQISSPPSNSFDGSTALQKSTYMVLAPDGEHFSVKYIAYLIICSSVSALKQRAESVGG